MNQTFKPTESGSKTQYRSYLLRLWCVSGAESGCWQASLDDPHTSERIGFGSLEDLFVFLIEQIETAGQDRAQGPSLAGLGESGASGCAS